MAMPWLPDELPHGLHARMSIFLSLSTPLTDTHRNPNATLSFSNSGLQEPVISQWQASLHQQRSWAPFPGSRPDEIEMVRTAEKGETLQTLFSPFSQSHFTEVAFKNTPTRINKVIDLLPRRHLIFPIPCSPKFL
jgi:hypothetical protein